MLCSSSAIVKDQIFFLLILQTKSGCDHMCSFCDFIFHGKKQIPFLLTGTAVSYKAKGHVYV